MNGQHAANLTETLWPSWWRWAIIAMSVLVLCSCRTAPRRSAAECQVSDSPSGNFAGQANTLPQSAWTGEPEIYAPGQDEVCIADDQVVGAHPTQAWAPPGIARPWPREEYLCDGGDRGIPARVNPDWQIYGLGPEDTVAHFDTLDGRLVVEPSNPVCIYAPRFGAVRKVMGISGYDHREAIVQYDVPTHAAVNEETLGPNTTTQNQQTERQIAALAARAQQRNNPSLTAGGAMALIEADGRQKLLLHRRQQEGIVARGAEEPMLAEHNQAVMTWTHDKGVQIILDDQFAAVEIGDARVHAVFTVGHEGDARLRVIKQASRSSAKPGEEIEFALQFINVGTEPLGNITLVDNLTTRLEYVPDSETSSVKADFLTQPNEGGSLVLRWEIIDPLPPGEEGVIRFKCRVR